MKKFLSFVVVLMIIMGTFAGMNSNLKVNAEKENVIIQDENSNEIHPSTQWLTYEISEGEVAITGLNPKNLYIALEIPAQIEGYPVTSIADYAFAESYLAGITIPNTVTSIGEHAFFRCRDLESVTMADSVTYIGQYAFYECSDLASVVLSSNLTRIEDLTFYYCNNLTSIILPNNITSIGYGAFEHCYNMTEIILPNNLTDIGERAFEDCRKLTNVIIPENVTSIVANVFSECSNLASITIPKGVEDIDLRAFYMCHNLTEIIIDEENESYYSKGNCIITKDANALIFGCKNSVIPDGVVHIVEPAFFGCENLTSITIPASVMKIDSLAFWACNNLKDVYYRGTESERNNISIGDSPNLIYATWHYNTCIDTTEHSFDNDCDAICNVCEQERTVTHNYEWIVDKTENCGENGIKHEECTVCHTKRSENTVIDATGNHTYDGNYGVKCNVCGMEKIILGTIAGATVDIGSTLTINYFAEVPEDAKMKFTLSSGRITEISGVYDAETGYYKFAYEGINPQCMNDTIKAELVWGDYVLDTKESYSVKAYCENQISKSASDLGLTAIQYDKLRTLLADMLVYGSEAQKYMNYNTENLPDTDEWVSTYKSIFSAPDGVKKSTGNGDAENKVKSAGLNMANVNRIYFKLILNDENVVIKLNNEVIDRAELIKNADGTFTLYSSDIKATGFNDVYTLTLTQGEEIISTVQYNVNAYVKSKNADATIGNIVKALSNYGKSATAYANSFKTIGDSSFEIEEDIL